MVTDLFDEARLLVHASKNWTETMHAGTGISAAMRAVLEHLLREGPSTVPDTARARLVSRQHIQQQADALLQRKLVQRDPNPAHRRSPLISLTDRGLALTKNMRAEELNALSHLQAGTSDSAMRDAAQVLAAWRNVLRNDARERSR